jgi:hypothetical protein
MPQSNKYFFPFFRVSKCLEPVTTRAAPWKAIFIIIVLIKNDTEDKVKGVSQKA